MVSQPNNTLRGPLAQTTKRSNAPNSKIQEPSIPRREGEGRGGRPTDRGRGASSRTPRSYLMFSCTLNLAPRRGCDDEPATATGACHATNASATRTAEGACLSAGIEAKKGHHLIETLSRIRMQYATPELKYRGRLKSVQIIQSRTQAGPGRKVMQEQEEISRNHVQTI